MSTIDEPRAGATIDLTCARSGWDHLRALQLPHGSPVIVRTGISKVLPIAGEIFTLEVTKAWIFGHTQYVKGEVTATRLDVEALDLTPLGLTCHPPYDDYLDDHDLPAEIAAELARLGPREACEMDQIVPEEGIELRWEDDPIVEAAELTRAGAYGEARDLLDQVTSLELRCLDAHAHLGNIEFSSSYPDAIERARRHYRVGVAIGELTLGNSFTKLLPWSMLDNRPHLRCLKGLGLSEWRLGNVDAARDIFRRLMIMSPMDNVGARFLWTEIQEGRPWNPSI